MTDLRERYRANHDRIARDYLARWREDGTNPFSPPEVIEPIDDVTAAIVRQYVPAGSIILDAGVALGNVLNRLPEYERYGLDISAEYLDIAASRGIDAVQGDVEAMPYGDASFDAVLAFDILEHVLDVHRACLELVRVCRSGGIILTRTPYRENLTNYIESDYDFIHLRAFDEPTMQVLFQRVYGCDVLGFQVIPYPVKNQCSSIGEMVTVIRKR